MKTYNSGIFVFVIRLSLVCTLLVILAGAVVRATGSGMGCPDWPKCFGRWVPPTEITQLPEGYKEHYIEKRKNKNEKFARYVHLFGATETANQILNDPAIYQELDFNPLKTWIEYVNRLLGVLLGICMTVLLWMSWKQRIIHPSVWWKSLTAYVLLLLEGWFGSIVVSTNLLPWTITLHMMLALAILALIIHLLDDVKPKAVVSLTTESSKTLKSMLIAAWLLTILQIIIGTQVREAVDEIATRIDNRSQWIEHLGWSYLIHRIVSIAIFILNMTLAYRILKKNYAGNIHFYTRWLLALISFEVAIGFIFKHFDLPAVVQPLHLLNASIIFGIQYYLLRSLRHHSVTIPEKTA